MMMQWIPNPILKPLPRAPRLSDEELAELTERLSLRQCATLCELTFGECQRRGLYRVKMGSKFFDAVESRVAYDVVARGLDLDEIASAIEEAKWESAL